jgi:very-short-patch-repair endonuclease
VKSRGKSRAHQSHFDRSCHRRPRCCIFSGAQQAILHLRAPEKREDSTTSLVLRREVIRTLGIHLLRIPNAMVLEHPDEIVREVLEAIRTSVEKAKK